jgi:Domain of unknown function (DUF4129)
MANPVLTPRAVLVGLVAVVVLLGVVLAAREAGPIPIDDRALLAGNVETTPSVTVPRPEAAPTSQSDDSSGLLAKISMWYVIVSWLAVLLVFVIAVRTLIAMREEKDDDSGKATAPAPDETPWPGTMESMRRAVVRAEEVLLTAEPGSVSDAVIGAWMQLEQAATVAGTGRRPSSTPSEFTVALLKRHAADPEAMTTLLALYHRARFGATPLPPSAGDEALAAVRTIAAALGVAPAGPR